MSEDIIPYHTARDRDRRDRIVNHIHRIARHCQKSGIHPIEVWLGPSERAALGIPKQITGEEVSIFYGFRIRLSATPGIRVGITVALPES